MWPRCWPPLAPPPRGGRWAWWRETVPSTVVAATPRMVGAATLASLSGEASEPPSARAATALVVGVANEGALLGSRHAERTPRQGSGGCRPNRTGDGGVGPHLRCDLRHRQRRRAGIQPPTPRAAVGRARGSRRKRRRFGACRCRVRPASRKRRGRWGCCTVGRPRASANQPAGAPGGEDTLDCVGRNRWPVDHRVGRWWLRPGRPGDGRGERLVCAGLRAAGQPDPKQVYADSVFAVPFAGGTVVLFEEPSGLRCWDPQTGATAALGQTEENVRAAETVLLRSGLDDATVLINAYGALRLLTIERRDGNLLMHGDPFIETGGGWWSGPVELGSRQFAVSRRPIRPALGRRRSPVGDRTGAADFRGDVPSATVIRAALGGVRLGGRLGRA